MEEKTLSPASDPNATRDAGICSSDLPLLWLFTEGNAARFIRVGGDGDKNPIDHRDNKKVSVRNEVRVEVGVAPSPGGVGVGGAPLPPRSMS